MMMQRPEYDDDQWALHCSLKLATNWGRSFLHFAKVDNDHDDDDDDVDDHDHDHDHDDHDDNDDDDIYDDDEYDGGGAL